MHAAGSHASHAASHQTQTGACCALAEETPATPSASLHRAPLTLAVVSTPVVAPAGPVVDARERWRISPHPSIASVPRHLLLSVFLV
jgi:hypothetical protein